jgi:uncharacterized membrane protein
MQLERRIARLLTVGSYLSVALLAVGFGAMLIEGRSPLDGGPPLDPRSIPADLLALRPAGFLWLGLLTVVATPVARVAVALFGYLRGNERTMAVVATLVLAVIALSVALAIGMEG